MIITHNLNQYNHMNYKSTKVTKPIHETNNVKQGLILGSLAGMAIAGALVVKSGKTSSLKKMYNDIIKEFPQDKKYYQTLAKGLKLPENETYKLAPITGPQQLKAILKKMSKEDFSVGANLEGVKNRTLRINLHNHTTHSDGYLTPEMMIAQASRWADEVKKTKGNDEKPPFVFAITDHDTLSGAKEAIKLVVGNPEKYKNLKLVLGAEISVSHINPNDVKEPMNFELIGYGLNPFNEKMNSFFDKIQKNRLNIVENFAAKVTEKYPQYSFDINEMRNSHRNLKNMRTNGVLYLSEDYVNNKILVTDIVEEVNKKIIPDNEIKMDPSKISKKRYSQLVLLLDQNKLKSSEIEFLRDAIITPELNSRGLLTKENKNVYEEIFQKDFSDKKKKVREIRDQFMPTIQDTKNYIITPEELFNTVRESGEQGFFGVAHPGQINAGMFSDDVARVADENNYDKGEHLAWRLYDSLKKSGGEYFQATEANYQSYKYHDDGALHWQYYMGEEKANEFGLLKSGGIDCHKPSIFKKHTFLTQEEIKNNNLENIINV